MKDYNIVIMPDGYPCTADQRSAFEKYMENGGGWMGFHESGYNDKDTRWPWLLQFLGGGSGNFYAFDEATGTEKWKFPTPGGITTSDALLVE